MSLRSRRTFRIAPGFPATGLSYGEQTLRTPVRQGHPKTGGVVAAIAVTAFVLLAIALA